MPLEGLFVILWKPAHGPPAYVGESGDKKPGREMRKANESESATSRARAFWVNQRNEPDENERHADAVGICTAQLHGVHVVRTAREAGECSAWSVLV